MKLYGLDEVAEIGDPIGWDDVDMVDAEEVDYFGESVEDDVQALAEWYAIASADWSRHYHGTGSARVIA